MKILVLNGGSSTLKATLCELHAAPPATPVPPLWSAQAEWGRKPGVATMRIRRAGVPVCEREFPIASSADVLAPVLETLWTPPAPAIAGPREIAVVGHRVVHGGHAFQETMRITPAVKEEIRKFVEFAPEHNRLELEAIEAAERIVGPERRRSPSSTRRSTPPCRCTPTSTRCRTNGTARAWRAMDSTASAISTPRGAPRRSWAGTRRIAPGHLPPGQRRSLAAMRDGKSIDTTMGFTPLEGLMMGTRSGSIDPGILIYLVRHRGYGADALDRVLNKESGLKGVSGIVGRHARDSGGHRQRQ